MKEYVGKITAGILIGAAVVDMAFGSPGGSYVSEMILEFVQNAQPEYFTVVLKEGTHIQDMGRLIDGGFLAMGSAFGLQYLFSKKPAD